MGEIQPGQPDAAPQRHSGWMAALLTVILVAYGNVIALLPLPEWSVFLANLAVGVVVVYAARAAGYSLPEIGLSRQAWNRGWRWGLPIAAIVVGFILIVGLAGRISTDPAVQGMSWGVLGWQVLIRISFGTALFEETMFRGVLFAGWKRTLPSSGAALLSSIAFALWHVVVEMHRQERQGHDWGNDALLVTIPILGFLFLAGMVLCWLRERSDGVIAPTIVHWAANSSAAIAVYLVSN